ncbi:MAG: 16S rRNA (guanine(527)-N(7))-methyltransferase RsmG [Bacillota bacterium]|nr:MAG: 16S rRNA (guanine(527)-N(7))-methyltransferase RsmG [Bacillota bacterium]
MDKIFFRYGIQLTDAQKEKFFAFFRYLTEENEKYNLTAVTDMEEVYCKHFVDSLLIVDMLKGGKLLDVGSGGGMPALPLAVVREDISFTLLEATGKKCEFLKSAANLLGLKNVTVVNGRAEELAKGEMRESFDTVTARAVARLNTLAEYCLPFVKVGGTFVAYKGDADEEVKEALSAIKILGGGVKETKNYLLEGAKRTAVFIEKRTPTPAAYPRGRGKERKNPL